MAAFQALIPGGIWGSLTPGENLGRLCNSIVPLLTNFGTHLQWQDNPVAHDFIPILDWLNQHGALDGFTIGLLVMGWERRIRRISLLPISYDIVSNPSRCTRVAGASVKRLRRVSLCLRRYSRVAAGGAAPG